MQNFSSHLTGVFPAYSPADRAFCLQVFLPVDEEDGDQAEYEQIGCQNQDPPVIRRLPVRDAADHAAGLGEGKDGDGLAEACRHLFR